MQKVLEKLICNKIIEPVSFEESLLNTRCYGISQLEITEKNPLLGKTLHTSKLKEHDILVLSVERGTEHIFNPQSEIKFTPGDKLICFGKLDNIRKVAYEE